MKQLGVVIPTYFAGKLLSRAIESVLASAKKAEILIEIIVVDCHPKSIIKFKYLEVLTTRG